MKERDVEPESFRTVSFVPISRSMGLDHQAFSRKILKKSGKFKGHTGFTGRILNKLRRFRFKILDLEYLVFRPWILKEDRIRNIKGYGYIYLQPEIHLTYPRKEGAELPQSKLQNGMFSIPKSIFNVVTNNALLAIYPRMSGIAKNMQITSFPQSRISRTFPECVISKSYPVNIQTAGYEFQVFTGFRPSMSGVSDLKSPVQRYLDSHLSETYSNEFKAVPEHHRFFPNTAPPRINEQVIREKPQPVRDRLLIHRPNFTSKISEPKTESRNVSRTAIKDLINDDRKRRLDGVDLASSLNFFPGESASNSIKNSASVVGDQRPGLQSGPEKRSSMANRRPSLPVLSSARSVSSETGSTFIDLKKADDFPKFVIRTPGILKLQKNIPARNRVAERNAHFMKHVSQISTMVTSGSFLPIILAHTPDAPPGSGKTEAGMPISKWEYGNRFELTGQNKEGSIPGTQRLGPVLMDLAKRNEPISTQIINKEKITGEKEKTSPFTDQISTIQMDMDRLTDQIYLKLEKKIRIERERRGM
jgi:hypothetical protein